MHEPQDFFLFPGLKARPWCLLWLLAVALGGMQAQAHPARAPQTHPGWVHPPLLASPAPPKPVEPPLRMSVRDAQGKTLRGSITAFDALGFLFRVRGEQDTRRLSWRVLEPARVLKIHDRLLGREDGEGWLQLGAALYARDAAEPGENAIKRALRADPGLAERAGLARDRKPIGDPAATAHGDDTDAESSERADDSGQAPRKGRSGPLSTGQTQNRFWGTLSDEVMESSVASLLAEAETARQTLGLNLKIYDRSKYYMFVSDMPAGEANRWAGLLDRLYDRLCDTFAVPRGTNVFRGRGLIYVFRQERDYHRFQRVLHEFDSSGSSGLCRSYGNGHVEITLYRQQSDELFSHVLVHEAVHGFLHRYRSHPSVVSWANEGLAEFVAADLVGLYRPREVRDRVARYLERAGGTGGMFDKKPIDGWQYPVAQALCDFMIAQDRGRYRNFINAIKDGKPWEEALEEDYGVTRGILLAAFGRALGLPELRN